MATDAASLAFGLPGALNACIQLCEKIQFARNYEGDFAVASARLMVAGLRLKQWGKALGLLAETNGMPLKAPAVPISARSMQEAKRIFDRILQAFNSVEEKSNKYAHQQGIRHAETMDATNDKTGLYQAIRSKLASPRSNARPVTAGFKEKARWIIYRRAHFNELLETICTVTKELMELFPIQRPVQQALCEKDLSSLSPSHIQRVFDPNFIGKDVDLGTACRGAMANAGLVFKGNTVTNRQGIDMGNEYETRTKIREVPGISVQDNMFSGSSVVRFGHSVGVARSYGARA